MEKILDSHCVEWRCGAVDPGVSPLLFVASYLRFGAFCCPLPSTGITQLHWYYGPIRRPKMPGLSVTGVRFVVPDHTMGFPVLLSLSLCTCCHQYPGAAAVFVFTQFLQPCQTSPIRFSGRPAHRPFRGFFCVPSRCGLHTRTATSTWQALPKGFGHIVTSIAAPVATGWSRGVGLTPTGKAPPFHGAQRTESFSITHYRAVPLHDFGDW